MFCSSGSCLLTSLLYIAILPNYKSLSCENEFFFFHLNSYLHRSFNRHFAWGFQNIRILKKARFDFLSFLFIRFDKKHAIWEKGSERHANNKRKVSRLGNLFMSFSTKLLYTSTLSTVMTRTDPEANFRPMFCQIPTKFPL